MDGLGERLFWCLFLNKNKKNTLKSFSLKEVDKGLTTVFPARGPPLFLARRMSGARSHTGLLAAGTHNVPVSYQMFR